MSNDLQQLEKASPMRAWLERHLGKVILTSIPVILTMLAGWIYTIGSEIAVIKEKIKEDEAQWSALLSTNERVKELEIELRVNQKLLYLISEKEIDPELLHLERLLKESRSPEPDEDISREPVRSPYPALKPREERLDEFRREQMEQVQQKAGD